ncbi:MAG: glycosyltransferase [Anaerolineae bacterium]
MIDTTQTSRRCPLCGSWFLTPVLYPPLVRCGECGLVFRNIQGAQERVKEGYEARYSMLELEQWVQDRRGPLYREFLIRYRPAPGRNRLLDVGCGTGQFLLLARAEGWDVTGVEIAEGGTESARAAGLPVLTGSLATQALPESSFNVVTLWNVLDCLPNPVEHVTVAKRVLAPGGVLCARVCNLSFHSTLWRLSRRFQRWPRLAALLAKHYFFNQVSFNARTLRQTLEQGGFGKIEIANSLPSYGDPYHTLRWGGDGLLQAVKRSISTLGWVIAAGSGGKVLLGSSLLATAVKEDSPCPDGREEMRGQMTLRVLFVSDVSPLTVSSGGERVLREQASRLAKLGHQVRVLSRSPEGGAREPVESEGVRVHHFPADRRSLLRFVRDSILGARQAAAQALSDTDADVLQLHQPLSGVGVLSSPAATRIPSLYTFLSPAPLEYRSRRAINASLLARWAGTPGTALLWVIEGICLRRASRIHVLSEFSATQLQKLYRIPSERIVKIPGGVDTERFRPAEDRDRVRKALGLPTRTVLLFTLRNLEPRMGLDALIRAMATLRQYAPEARLLIGGTGSLRQALESLTASLGLRDQVSFLGFIPETELPLYYQAADAFVLPSRELEGFGLVTAEALACGTPVLGTRVGAIPEVLGGLGADLLFDRGDYEAIARGIRNHLKRALADPGGYEALRRRCRDYAVSRFSWDQVAKQMEQELFALAGGFAGGEARPT